MPRKFNITGICVPSKHYMVDMSAAIEQIENKFIRQGEYFTINRARQYGKSTLLELLYRKLEDQYIVIDMSFEAADDCFVSMYTMAQGFVNKVSRSLREAKEISKDMMKLWEQPISREWPLDSLGNKISDFCRLTDRKVVLLIDEVDKAADNQIFLSFLGLLRERYLRREAGRGDTFQSVVLAGVHDIRNLKMKLHPGQEQNYNSPWNIAAEFNVDMSLSRDGIHGMLADYDADYHTGADMDAAADIIYEYTCGYPFLVSYICKKVDEEIAGSSNFPTYRTAWTREGILEAVKLLIKGPNTLYDDMIKHITDHQDLQEMLNNILFEGQKYPYQEYDKAVSIGRMFGFITEKDGMVTVANRIFESQIYNYFLSEELKKNHKQREALPDRNQFIQAGSLDMDLVMEKFYEYYQGLYSEEDEGFVEKYGRKLFLMYLKPIINGAGNFYVEDQSRTKLRTDIVVDYKGKQYIVECKIWRGAEYNRQGEEQLAGYLEAYRVQKGYLLSFRLGKQKKTGIRRQWINGKEILEIVV